MPSRPQGLSLLVVGLLVSGTINTLLNKFQDLQCAVGCHGPHPRTFEQPIWQTANMFLGEAFCLVVYHIQVWHENRKQKTYVPILDASNSPHNADSAPHDDAHDRTATPLTPWASQRVVMSGWANLYMWLPTLCDLTATTLMNVGLIYVAASVYQMLRGAVVLFTGTLSTIYLGRTHPLYRWYGLCAVSAGVSLVGAASVVQADPPSKPSSHDNSSIYASNPSNAPLGVAMVLIAQIFTAAQFVIEEKLLSYYELPAMKAVGLEGIFGLLSLAIMVPIVTSRSTIDTCRTLFIWMISLALGWENFKSLQVAGFLVLLYGTFVFNDVVRPPLALCREGGREEEVAIPQESDERAVASAT
ncbi:hypothetical protein SeMB42_g04099 [Synchytrium endobioticum]|uniref:EamA domain-containing protein n=1 Tax=Synchytrium endobioticum TaxID=286115 RepID=A0A507C3T9_9FUNG|nr:hypothetical protein SeLEV6574_g08156 [Synchytrium endobioticum]TPX45112.1 hypothetical protein SeMB42_g04099 [Synchytrium endobioticum]